MNLDLIKEAIIGVARQHEDEHNALMARYASLKPKYDSDASWSFTSEAFPDAAFYAEGEGDVMIEGTGVHWCTALDWDTFKELYYRKMLNLTPEMFKKYDAVVDDYDMAVTFLEEMKEAQDEYLHALERSVIMYECGVDWDESGVSITTKDTGVVVLRFGTLFPNTKNDFEDE